MGVCRQVWVLAGRTEHVKGDFCLWEKPTPEVQKEQGVHSTQARNKVVLEGTQVFFRGISLVIMRWDHLQVVIVCIHDEPFEAMWTLIVHSVLGWTETPGFKEGEDVQLDPTRFSFGAIA